MNSMDVYITKCLLSVQTIIPVRFIRVLCLLIITVKLAQQDKRILEMEYSRQLQF